MKKTKKSQPRVLRAAVTACASSYGMSTVHEGQPYSIPFNIMNKAEMRRKWFIGPQYIYLDTERGEFHIEGSWGDVNYLMICIEHYHELYQRH